MDLVGPIGGPAFSSQTLLWWPLEYNHNLPGKTLHAGFPPFSQTRHLHILQRAPRYVYGLACEM